jgi:actin-like ATPase involved in cell morphogenesis
MVVDIGGGTQVGVISLADGLPGAYVSAAM